MVIVRAKVFSCGVWCPAYRRWFLGRCDESRKPCRLPHLWFDLPADKPARGGGLPIARCAAVQAPLCMVARRLLPCVAGQCRSAAVYFGSSISLLVGVPPSLTRPAAPTPPSFTNPSLAWLRLPSPWWQPGTSPRLRDRQGAAGTLQRGRASSSSSSRRRQREVRCRQLAAGQQLPSRRHQLSLPWGSFQVPCSSSRLSRLERSLKMSWPACLATWALAPALRL